jgi:hypothetical protein
MGRTVTIPPGDPPGGISVLDHPWIQWVTQFREDKILKTDNLSIEIQIPNEIRPEVNSSGLSQFPASSILAGCGKLIGALQPFSTVPVSLW